MKWVAIEQYKSEFSVSKMCKVLKLNPASYYSWQKTQKKKLSEYRITGSMSKPGCPYDNSCMESFFATLKKERIYRKQYSTMEEVKQDMFQYIELFYNRRRLHSVLGYMSPVDYRLKYDGKKPA